MKNHNVKLFINTSSSWQYFDTHNDNYKPTSCIPLQKPPSKKNFRLLLLFHEFVSHTLIIYDTYGQMIKRKNYTLFNKKLSYV